MDLKNPTKKRQTVGMLRKVLLMERLHRETTVQIVARSTHQIISKLPGKPVRIYATLGANFLTLFLQVPCSRQAMGELNCWEHFPMMKSRFNSSFQITNIQGAQRYIYCSVLGWSKRGHPWYKTFQASQPPSQFTKPLFPERPPVLKGLAVISA